MAKKKFIAIVAAAVCAVAVLVVVLVKLLSGGAAAPKQVTFLSGTTINGQDVSGLSVEQAAETLKQRTEGYTFALALGDKTYSVTAQELSLAYNDAADVQSALDQQSADSTQTSFVLDDLYTADLTALRTQVEADFGTTDAAAAEGDTAAAEGDTSAPEGDTSAAAEGETAEGETGEGEVAAVEVEDPNAPKNAFLKYDETTGLFVIEPDVPGTEVDCDKVLEQAQLAVLSLESQLELDMAQFAKQADVTADSETLKAALADANERLDISLTYTFTPEGGSTSEVTIPRETLGTFFCASADGQSVEVDEEVLGSYVSDLASQYSISGGSQQFKTTGGGTINISVAQAGQSVDSEGLYNDMLDCLTNKVGGTRTAPYVAKSDDGNGFWGGNYVEINLTSQTLWLYKDGNCILSCPVVSGCVAANTRTPTGCFTIFAKNTNRYLQGSNTDGTRYKTWVDYFMPFSGGCGIHDATWRSVFGGTEYLYSGSHGCVGITLGNAKTVFNNVSVGTHVVVYGGLSASQLPSTEPTITANADEVTIEVGQSLDLGFSTNSDGAKRWVTSNNNVSLDNGVVTGQAVGDCIAALYTSASGNYTTGSKNVLVHVVAAGSLAKDQSVSIAAGSSGLTIGQTTKISVSGNQTIASFTSSNSGVLTVDGNGNVTAVGAGSATVTVSCPASSAYRAWSGTVTISVGKQGQSISASAGSSTLTVGGSGTTISVSGAQGSLSFSSSDSSVASVDANGHVTAVGAGSATITVTAAETGTFAGGSTTVTITVNAAPPVDPGDGSGSGSGSGSSSNPS